MCRSTGSTSFGFSFRSSKDSHALWRLSRLKLPEMDYGARCRRTWNSYLAAAREVFPLAGYALGHMHAGHRSDEPSRLGRIEVRSCRANGRSVPLSGKDARPYGGEP